MAEVEVEAPQSEVLSQEEVTNITEGVEPEEAVLPSDEVEFEIPEKFQGKSIEDVIKSYQELEKFKAPPAEEVEGGDVAQEEKGDEPEETSNDYSKRYAEEGLTPELNQELLDAGHSQEDITKWDNELKEKAEFEAYKTTKELEKVLEPLGGGADKLKEVGDWALETYGEETMDTLGKDLDNASLAGKQAILRGLYKAYEDAGAEEGVVLHTNTPQTSPSKGYKTQEEFFKDVGSEEYQNNPAYRKAVEAKMAKSTIF